MVEKYTRDSLRGGSLELIFGSGVLLAGVFWGIDPDNFAFVGVGYLAWFMLAIWMGIFFKQRILFPRLGYAKFWQRLDDIEGAHWQTGFFSMVLYLTPSMFVFNIAAHWAAPGPEWNPPGWDVVPLARMACVLFPGCFIGGISRYWGWKYLTPLLALTLVLAHISRLWQINFGWTFALIGVAMICAGLVRLLRFLRDYPVLEAADGEL
jgi:hypothetical protein